MKIMFDIDGVLANFIEGFRMEYAHVHGRVFPIEYEDIRWDDLWDEKVWAEIKKSKGWWTMLTAIPERRVFRRISMMANHHDIYYVTARPGYHAKAQTETWLRLQGVEDPTVVMSNKKGEIAKSIKADYSIEDKAGNAAFIAYFSPNTKSFIIDRPYNQFDPKVIGSKVIRVKEIEQFLAAIDLENA
jgi:uncharacterized HAD superfamily protein